MQYHPFAKMQSRQTRVMLDPKARSMTYEQRSIRRGARRIIINDVPETVEVIDLDDYVSDEDLDRGERDKSFQILKKTYPEEIRNFGICLNEYITTVYHPTECMTPIDHFMIKQVTLAAYGIATRFKRERLGCDDCRDHFENLACLLEFVEQHNAAKSAMELSQQLGRLITVCGRITSYLEDMSKKHVTIWDQVAKFYKTVYNTQRYPQRHSEFAPYIGYFNSCSLLAIGSFGTIHLAKLGTIDIVIKVVTKRKSRQNAKKCKNRKTSLSTAEIGFMVRHPICTMVYATFTTKEAYVTVMEYVKGVDGQRMYMLARYLPSNVVTVLAAQLFLAIEYMHYLGFIHRDIKPSNMIITCRCRLQICDFDTAKVCTGMYSSRLMTGFLRRTIREFNDKEEDGTVGYYAPELVNKQPYGRAIDWWAVGVTIFTLRYGRLPFRAPSEAQLKQKINTGKVQFSYEEVPTEAIPTAPKSASMKTSPPPVLPPPAQSYPPQVRPAPLQIASTARPPAAQPASTIRPLPPLLVATTTSPPTIQQRPIIRTYVSSPPPAIAQAALQPSSPIQIIAIPDKDDSLSDESSIRPQSVVPPTKPVVPQGPSTTLIRLPTLPVVLPLSPTVSLPPAVSLVTHPSDEEERSSRSTSDQATSISEVAKSPKQMSVKQPFKSEETECERSSSEKVRRSPELRGGIPPCVAPSSDNTEDLNRLISALLTVPVNSRMCSKRYTEFREHPSFREINWDWIEDTEDVYCYPLIERLMKRGPDGDLVPIATEARPVQLQDRTFAFELNKLTDAPKQPRLYVFMSEGFSHCVTEVAYRRRVDPVWVKTHPELIGKFQENTPYKFKDFFKGNRL